MKAKDVKKRLTKKKKKKKSSYKNFISTGSTLLNLACTGSPYRGFAMGKYYRLVGDSTSGKTFLSLTCLAEASINPRFNKHRFIYDNAEDGAMMDIQKFFGSEVARRMEPPGDSFSSNIEEFYYHVDDANKLGVPYIYILDSMDSLSSGAESNKFDEQKNAYRKGKSTAGSFGDGKAKFNSANLRKIISFLQKEQKSILIIISQTRDNIGFGFEKKTSSGGRAVKFYATLEIWSSVKGRISKVVRGKARQQGIKCCLQVKKNRISGKERTITIPIYHSTGMDDTGSCVDYLIEEKHWIQKEKGGLITAPEFKFKGKKEKLIQTIEENIMERDLREIVSDVWNEIEEACSVKRKKRYE